MENRDEGMAETPILEVHVFRDGVLIARESCESEAEAADAVRVWQEEPGIEAIVVDPGAGPSPMDAPEREADDESPLIVDEDFDEQP